MIFQMFYNQVFKYKFMYIQIDLGVVVAVGGLLVWLKLASRVQSLDGKTWQEFSHHLAEEGILNILAISTNNFRLLL